MSGPTTSSCDFFLIKWDYCHFSFLNICLVPLGYLTLLLHIFVCIYIFVNFCRHQKIEIKATPTRRVPVILHLYSVIKSITL